MNSYEANIQAVSAAVAKFPATFHLRSNPTDVFRVSTESSYVNDSGVVMLYTEIQRDGKWLSYAKGTERELSRELVPLSANVHPHLAAAAALLSDARRLPASVAPAHTRLSLLAEAPTRGGSGLTWTERLHAELDAALTPPTSEEVRAQAEERLRVGDTLECDDCGRALDACICNDLPPVETADEKRRDAALRAAAFEELPADASADEGSAAARADYKALTPEQRKSVKRASLKMLLHSVQSSANQLEMSLHAYIVCANGKTNDVELLSAALAFAHHLSADAARLKRDLQTARRRAMKTNGVAQ
jgi:hypothetical protein